MNTGQPQHDDRHPASPKTPWYRQLPAKAAAVVVFLVALTTLAGNLLELRNKSRESDEASPAAVPTPPATPAQSAPRTEDEAAILRVERIVVEHDGSPGTTDWRFAVLADGEPLFAFAQGDLDDGDGRNVAVPRDAQARCISAPAARCASKCAAGAKAACAWSRASPTRPARAASGREPRRRRSGWPPMIRPRGRSCSTSVPRRAERVAAGARCSIRARGARIAP